MKRTMKVLAAAATLCAASFTTQAAVLLTDAEGHLTGATGVEVFGALYDVSFVDGSCVDAMNGCDSSADFTFGSFGMALSAATALVDQVFLDGPQGAFDSQPWLTYGCGSTAYPYCWAMTAYGVGGGLVNTVVAGNRTPYDESYGLYDGPRVAGDSFSRTADMSGSDTQVWAVWTPSGTAEVPEPASAALVGLALAAALGARRAGARKTKA